MKFISARRFTMSLFLIGTIYFSLLTAQESNQSGYIITNGNDTIRGFIQNINLNQFNQCLFKAGKGSAVVNYLPGEIQAYRFAGNGKFFISKDVPTPSGKKLLFVEYLIKGKANIYFRRDDTDHYYIQKEDGELMELSEPQVILKTAEGLSYIKPKHYTGKLKYILSDCPDLYNEIDEVKLYPDQLIKLAKDYHDKVCDSAKCIIFERKINPVRFNFGVLAGVSYNDFVFNADNYTDKRAGEFGGFKLEVENLFFSLERLTINAGLMYQRFSTYTLHTDYYLEYNVAFFKNIIKDIDIKASTIKIPVSIKYAFTQTKLRPYIGIGMVNQFYLTQNKDLFIFDFNNYFGKAIPLYHAGAFGLAGISYKINDKNSVFMELNYEYSGNYNPNKMLQMQNRYLSMQFGYMF